MAWLFVDPILFFFPITHGHLFLLLFRERGKEKREIDGNIDVKEKHQLIASGTCPDVGGGGNWTHNLGMCADQGWNPQPFCLRDDAPTNWATPARVTPVFLWSSVYMKLNLLFLLLICLIPIYLLDQLEEPRRVKEKIFLLNSVVGVVGRINSNGWTRRPHKAA